eukprot:TRINITY_DN12606_c0_g1_i3.p1 TRINITY_DN12606_c0_g1~~TRINITY_DN12606_c0_g1_i3.p1  ORF type:complete len:514 (+),score=134.79 TRINITY_DN12606_c0_g1_i3:1452-2993(+)
MLRLVRFFGLVFVLQDSGSRAFGGSLGSVGTIAYRVVLMAVTVRFYSPVFKVGDESLPPPPTSDLWRRVPWRPEWVEWALHTEGARSLYWFRSLEEEQEFVDLQHAANDGPELPAGIFLNLFNFEVCVRLLGIATESYQLDTHSPAVSAAAAALLAVAASSSAAEGGGGPPLPVPPDAAAVRGVVTPSLHRYELVRVISQGGMQVLIARRGPSLAVAFRGSSNMRNWRDDFRVPKSRWTEMPAAAPRPSWLRRCCCCVDDNVPMVHSGFLAVWQGVEEQVLAAVRQHLPPGGSVQVTGHSLGAACAVLCAYSIARNVHASPELYTFGAPLIGNVAFKQRHKMLVPRHFRVVNDGDIITRFGLTPGNAHVGRPVLVAASATAPSGYIVPDACWAERRWHPSTLCCGAGAHGIRFYAAALATAGSTLGVPAELRYGRLRHEGEDAEPEPPTCCRCCCGGGSLPLLPRRLSQRGDQTDQASCESLRLLRSSSADQQVRVAAEYGAAEVSEAGHTAP